MKASLLVKRLLIFFSSILECDSEGTTECESGWFLCNDHCYQRQADKRSYDKAREDCATKKSMIAVPNTEAENNFLTTIMNPKAYAYTWIGFDYDNSERWEDGTSSSGTSDWRVLYEVDDSGDRGNGEPVVFMRPNGAWSFDGKHFDYEFVCEKEPGRLQLRNILRHSKGYW